MEPRYLYLTLMFVSAAVLSTLTGPSRSEFDLPSYNSTIPFTRKNDSETLLTPVGMLMYFILCYEFHGLVLL